MSRAHPFPRPQKGASSVARRAVHQSFDIPPLLLTSQSIPRTTMQQGTLNPAVLKSSPLRQLYEVLSVFERNRDWSIVARRQLIDQVSARLPQLHQPDVFLLHSLLEEIGIDPASTEGLGRSSSTVSTIGGGSNATLDALDSVPSISQFSRSSSLPRLQTQTQSPQGLFAQPPPPTALQATDDSGSPVLTPQVAGEMTPQEMSAFVMLKMFGDLSEQRIESWGRIAKQLIVTQPMDGFVAKEEELVR